MKTLTLTTLALLLACTTSFSQPKRKKSKQIEYINSLQLTGGLGTGTYFGDLCDNFDCAVFRPNLSVGLIYRNSDRLLFRNEFHLVRLYGSDAGGQNNVRNLHFRSTNYEVTWGAIYDLTPYERKFRYRTPFTPYAHGAIGFTYFAPQAELNGTWYNLRSLQTEGVSYSKFTPVISYGLGVRYKVSPELNISGEAGYRFTFTDYLDDVSGVYIDNSSLSGEAALLADRTNETDETITNRNYDQATQSWNAGHKRGNPKRNDGYFVFEIKAEYRIKWMAQGGSILRKAKFR